MMASKETGTEPPAELLEEFRQATASNGAAPAGVPSAGDRDREDERRLEAMASVLTEEAPPLPGEGKRCRLCEAAPGVLLAMLGLGLVYVGVDLATGGWLSRRLAGPPPGQEEEAGDGSATD
jgi:hypothetical protein